MMWRAFQHVDADAEEVPRDLARDCREARKQDALMRAARI